MKAIIGWVLAVIFLVIAGIFFWFDLKDKKDSKYWKSQFEACRDAPIKVDTIKPAPQTVSLPQQKPKPHNLPFLSVQANPAPVSIVDTGCTLNSYSDSTSDNDLTIFYGLQTRGTLEWIKHDYRLKVPREIRTTRTIYETKEVPTEVNKSHLYAFGSIGYDFHSIASPEIGLQWNYKTWWGLQVSYEYSDRSVIKGGVIFKLK